MVTRREDYVLQLSLKRKLILLIELVMRNNQHHLGAASAGNVLFNGSKAVVMYCKH
ncbi:MAG: hypothetical protein ABUL58_02685 [Steroidobacter sp.]